MEPLARTLESLTWKKQNSPPPVPDDALCPDCQWLLTDHPAFHAIVEARGLHPSRVTCRCAGDKARRTREQRRADEMRYLAAELPHSYDSFRYRTFANFTFSNLKEQTEVKDAALSFASGEGPRVLVLRGTAGTGKSHLLEAIGRESLGRGKRVKYILASDLLRRIRLSIDSGTRDSNLDDCYETGVLLLDDLGMGKPTEWTEETYTALVDHRYRNGMWLAIATNLSRDEMVEWGGFRLASRLYDVTGPVLQVLLRGKDRRAA